MRNGRSSSRRCPLRWKAGKGGRPAHRCRRDYVDAIRYLVKEGIQWRAMPADLPHWRTVYDVAGGWHNSGATGKMHDELRRQCRIAAGRSPEPTAAVIDSQSVKAAEEAGRASRGRTATQQSRCYGTCAAPSPRSSWPGPTAATPANSSPGPQPRSSPG
jgi:transposase